MKAERRPDVSAARGSKRQPSKEVMLGAHGKAALDKLYRGQTAQGLRPLLFLDFDDVICLNNPDGGYDRVTVGIEG
jgi:hypothetical protein